MHGEDRGPGPAQRGVGPASRAGPTVVAVASLTPATGVRSGGGISSSSVELTSSSAPW